jgi:hypothetical protein
MHDERQPEHDIDSELKLPAITATFWAMKIATTTLGETGTLPGNCTARSGRWARLGLLAAALGTLASCATLTGTARENFATSHTCPPDRVTVAPRPDMTRNSLTPRPAPPPEVAADPGRLAYWREQLEKAESNLLPCEVFELTGCGQHQLVCCTHYFHDLSGRTLYATQASCSELPGSR